MRRFITANAIDFILSFGHDSRSRKAGYKKRTPRVRYAVPLGSDASDPRGTLKEVEKIRVEKHLPSWKIYAEGLLAEIR